VHTVVIFLICLYQKKQCQTLPANGAFLVFPLVNGLEIFSKETNQLQLLASGLLGIAQNALETQIVFNYILEQSD
jgi:hypothetical protein